MRVIRRRRCARPAEQDAGSLPLALLLTMLVVSFGALVLPVTLDQVGGTRQTVTRGRALHAATTGLEVAVSAVRAAYRTGGGGDRTLLPCGPIEGTAGDGAGATYSVTLTYYDDDPAVAGAGTLICSQETGPVAAKYVRLTATGTTTGGSPSVRRVRGDYPLRVAPPSPSASATPSATWGPSYDDYVHPREILAWSGSRSATQLCLDPGNARPAPGTVVKLQRCNADNVEDNSYRQNWYYRQNLSISTVGSILADKAVCLDAGAVPAPGVVVTMQPCVTPVPPRQRWYYNAYSNFELAESTGPGQDDVALSGLCLNVANPGVVGSNAVLGGGGNCRSAAWDNRQTFSTYTKLGPGEAGSRPIDCTEEAGYPCQLTQVFNNAMPSRCIDRYSTFMANMECVQDPDPARIRWNQLWRLPVLSDGTTGTVGPMVTVDPDGKTWCLTTSTTWPTQVECKPEKPAANQLWTFYRNTGDEFTMYRIVDANGRCLTHPNGSSSMAGAATFYWNQASYHWKLVVDRCINSNRDAAAEDEFNRASVLRRQKWNAPMVLPTTGPGTPTAPTGPTPVPATSPVPNARGAVELRNLQEIS